jgi:hypothetical protein
LCIAPENRGPSMPSSPLTLLRRVALMVLVLGLWSMPSVTFPAVNEGSALLLPMAVHTPSGPHVLSPRSVPLGVRCIGLRLDITNHLDPVSRVQFQLQFSLDGGETWPLEAGAVSPGGVIVYEGVTQQYAGWRVPDLPEPENPNRQIRGRYQVTGADAEFALEGRWRDQPCYE